MAIRPPRPVRRLSKHLVALLTVSIIYTSISIERIGHCDGLFSSRCESEKCVSCASEADRLWAEASNTQGSNRYSLEFKTAHKLADCYSIEKHLVFLYSAGAIYQREKMTCQAGEFYGRLLREDPDLSKTVEETRDQNVPLQIGNTLLDCKKQEAAQNEPIALWFKEGREVFKKNSHNDIFMTKDMVLPTEYISELKNEHNRKLKKEFPNLYRTQRAGFALIGIGIAGAVVSGISALTTLFIKDDFLSDPSQRGVMTTGSAISAGAFFGLIIVGTLVGVAIPEVHNDYNKRKEFKVPRYMRVGFTARPF